MARAFNGVQVLVLVGAGVGAFYAAAQLSRPARDASDGIVAPADRATPATARGVLTGAAPRPSDAAVRAAVEPQPAASATSDARGDRSLSTAGPTNEPFATLSWLPPPPPPPKPIVVVAAPPAAPVAPRCPSPSWAWSNRARPSRRPSCHAATNCWWWPRATSSTTAPTGSRR